MSESHTSNWCVYLAALQVQRHGPYSEHGAACVLWRLNSALLHVHEMGLIHRDIKPQNILLHSRRDRNSVLLSDFDMAIEDSASAADKFGLVGTQG